MKRVNWVLFGVLFILSCIAQAQPVENDLQVRLQQEVATYKQEIETLRGEPLIKTADLITGSGLSDPALYAVVEAKTRQLFAENTAKASNKIVVDELNAVIRALGSMNKDSRDLIIQVLETSKSRSVRNRVKRLHPKLDWFVQRNTIMQKTDTYQPGQDLMTHRYLNLLATDDYVSGRWAMEEMGRRGGAEQVVYDKMREILAQEKSAIKNSVHLDYLAWITKLLSQYDATNSAELLNSIKNDPAEDKNTKKLKKYVKV